jgi:excisionase family DNA binding protein
VDLKIKDFLELLQISERTLNRWVQENTIPCHRIRHRYRFNRAEIHEWIQSRNIELAPRHAAGACAISGGLFDGSPAVDRSFFEQVPVDLYVPGCPPHPLTFIHALLGFLGRR